MEEELSERLRRWCAYQERCISQLKEKMHKMNLNDEQKSRFPALLIEEGFIDEERFAVSFASGKIRLKKWGVVKVRAELGRLKIPESIIQIALDAFDKEEYDQLVIDTARKKSALLRETDSYIKTGKIAQFLVSKGIEQQQAWHVAKLVVE